MSKNRRSHLWLRRLRHLHGLKQEHLAELLGVSQPTLSRLERGQLELTGNQRAILERVFTREASRVDAAIARLIHHTTLPTHLIEDRSHRLLAASPERWRQWCLEPSEVLGASLKPYATEEIVKSEAGLEASGWFEDCNSDFEFWTGGNDDPRVPIDASLVRWERMILSDGTLCRLVTTMAE